MLILKYCSNISRLAFPEWLLSSPISKSPCNSQGFFQMGYWYMDFFKEYKQKGAANTNVTYYNARMASLNIGVPFALASFFFD